MGKHRHKTYLCEWVAEVFQVDQYDRRINEPPFYEKSFHERKDALEDLINVTKPHPHIASARVYPSAPHGYYSTGVRYREVPIKDEVIDDGR